jgi:HD-GYP domain-containing protein (c-di-GMP phosphodiesterase class II)
MRRIRRVHTVDFIISLSRTMEMASPELARHQENVGYIVDRMGRAAGLSGDRLFRCLIASLLHDVGAFSLEEKVALRTQEETDVETHCIRGRNLLSAFSPFKEAAQLVRYHHREWRQWDESIVSPLVFDSQLLCLGDYVERQIDRKVFVLHQHEAIRSNVAKLAGSKFHKEIVELFLLVSEREEFWLDIVGRSEDWFRIGGNYTADWVDWALIVQASELYRDVIDFKSRFTATHSSGVAACAGMLARLFGLTETEVSLMEVAGNVHDIAKLAVPNSILEKPGALNREEMAIMKSHTYYTYHVISGIGDTTDIVEWAAFHHERLDGSGYPFRCKAEELSTGARIMMVADIFTALAEDRPYRRRMTRTGIVPILEQMQNRGALDARFVRLLIENYGEIETCVAESQAAARQRYEAAETVLAPQADE